jgi:hypothetical protein
MEYFVVTFFLTAVLYGLYKVGSLVGDPLEKGIRIVTRGMEAPEFHCTGNIEESYDLFD